jgi:hypothetical protein
VAIAVQQISGTNFHSRYNKRCPFRNGFPSLTLPANFFAAAFELRRSRILALRRAVAAYKFAVVSAKIYGDGRDLRKPIP